MVNLIDLFLVVIGILIIVILQNPLSPFAAGSVTVIENPDTDDMRVTIKQGETLQSYEAGDSIGEGQGVRAGVTYRLDDGRMIYIPEGWPPGAASPSGSAARGRGQSLPRFQNSVSPELSSTPSLSVTTQALPSASKASPSTLSMT